MKLVFAAALAILASACVPPRAENTASSGDNEMVADTMTVPDMATGTPSPASSPGTGWTYATSEDKMRGSTGRTAVVASSDTLELGSPYGSTTPELTIRQDPKFGFDIYFTSNGQPQCDEYSNPRISVKFDDGPVQEWGCNRAADGSPGIVFFASEKSLLSKLKSAKTMMVEVNYYDAGRQQFSFPVAGLKWD